METGRKLVEFVPPHTLPSAIVKVTYFRYSPITILLMSTGEFRVCEVSTGHVHTCKTWTEALEKRWQAIAETSP